ncbi:hypothetical protein BJY00DRAFT_312750 [Aspergillus carlsbadensis]|nr:hypothetical protein BJY00DRAFT_312750 [Aspergillus carlsbadensis]
MRFHLPTLFSTLLAGSLLHHAAVSVPLRPDGPQSKGLDIAGKELFNNWTVIEVPIAGRAEKRQFEDELPGDSDDTDVNLEVEAEHLSWSDAVEDGIRNIAKLDNPQGIIPTRGYEPYTMFYQDDRIGTPNTAQGDEGAPEDQQDDCDDDEDDPEDGQDVTEDDQDGPEDVQADSGENPKTGDVIPLSQTGTYPGPLLEALTIESMETIVRGVDIYSKEQGGKKWDDQDAYLSSAFLPEKKVIFVTWSYKNNDHNPAEQKIQANEIMLQLWDELADEHDNELAGGAGPNVVSQTRDQLEWVVQSHIINKGTQKILRLAAKRLQGEDYKRTWIRVTREDNPEEFNALSGTENCKGLYPSLANHDSGRFRNRRVREMWIWKGFRLEDFILMKVETQ